MKPTVQPLLSTMVFVANLVESEARPIFWQYEWSKQFCMPMVPFSFVVNAFALQSIFLKQTTMTPSV